MDSPDRSGFDDSVEEPGLQGASFLSGPHQPGDPKGSLGFAALKRAPSSEDLADGADASAAVA